MIVWLIGVAISFSNVDRHVAALFSLFVAILYVTNRASWLFIGSMLSPPPSPSRRPLLHVQTRFFRLHAFEPESSYYGGSNQLAQGSWPGIGRPHGYRWDGYPDQVHWPTPTSAPLLPADEELGSPACCDPDPSLILIQCGLRAAPRRCATDQASGHRFKLSLDVQLSWCRCVTSSSYPADGPDGTVPGGRGSWCLMITVADRVSGRCSPPGVPRSPWNSGGSGGTGVNE